MKPRWQSRVENIGAAVIILSASFAVGAILLAIGWRVAEWILT